MKQIFAKLSLVALGSMSILSSCTKATDVTPNASKPTAIVTFDGNQSTYGTESDFAVNATVSPTGDTAYINISVTNNASVLNKIYMSYQQDGGKEAAFKTFPNGTSIPGAGYSCSAANNNTGKAVTFDYVGNDPLRGGTFDIASGVQTFNVTIPILLRNNANAEADIFKIWITGSGLGSFTSKAKNLAYGVATVTLKYTTQSVIYNYSAVVGNANDTTASLLSSATGSTFTRAIADKASVGGLVDFVYNTVHGSATGNTNPTSFVFGSFYNGSSVDTLVKHGFGDVAFITNSTSMYATTISANDFNAITSDATLETQVSTAISAASGVSNKIIYNSDPSGSVFAFVTAKGKKGLVLIGTVSGLSSSAASEVPLTVLVQQ